MTSKNEIKVIEENKPDQKQVKNQMEQLSVFLGKNWVRKLDKNSSKG